MGAGNVELVRKRFEDYERGGFDATLDTLAEDVEWHTAGGLEARRVHRGIEEIRSALLEYVEDSWSEHHVEPERFAGAGDRVVVVYRERGIGPGSGAEVEARRATVYTVRGGKVTRIEDFLDAAQALTAVGLR